jgi:hypothetical protein
MAGKRAILQAKAIPVALELFLTWKSCLPLPIPGDRDVKRECEKKEYDKAQRREMR